MCLWDAHTCKQVTVPSSIEFVMHIFVRIWNGVCGSEFTNVEPLPCLSKTFSFFVLLFQTGRSGWNHHGILKVKKKFVWKYDIFLCEWYRRHWTVKFKSFLFDVWHGTTLQVLSSDFCVCVWGGGGWIIKSLKLTCVCAYHIIRSNQQ